MLALTHTSLLVFQVGCELNPPLQYSTGGFEVGVASHTTLPSILQGGIPLQYSGGGYEAGATLFSILEFNSEKQKGKLRQKEECFFVCLFE